MRLSIKYEEKLRNDKFLDIGDVGVISTEICRLKSILKSVGVSTKDKDLEKLKLWKN